MNKLSGIQFIQNNTKSLINQSQISQCQKSHVLNVLNSKSMVNTLKSPRQHVNHNKHFEARFQFQNFNNFLEVHQSFRKVAQIKKGYVDSKAPGSFKMFVPRRLAMTKDFEAQNHQRIVLSLINRIEGMEKQYNNKFKEIQSPSVYLGKFRYQRQVSGTTTLNRKFIDQDQIHNFGSNKMKLKSKQRKRSVKNLNYVFSSEFLKHYSPAKAQYYQNNENYTTLNNQQTPQVINYKNIQQSGLNFLDLQDTLKLTEDDYFSEQCYINYKKLLIHLIVKYNIQDENVLNEIQQLIFEINPSADEITINTIFDNIRNYFFRI